MLKEEAGKLDLYSKVSNVGNGIDPTRPPDDLAQVLNFSISDNLE